MNKFTMLIMLFMSISFSQANTIYKNGTECECDSIHHYYNESDEYIETPYVNGERNGIEKRYYANGNIYMETPFVNDMANGIQKGYNEDGSLRWETPYVNGEINGIEKGYYEDGKLAGTAKYKNGILDGYKHCSDGRIGNEQLDCFK